jgi:hypothetical protein
MHRRTCRADSGLAEVKRKRQQTRQLILLTTKNWNDLDADMELSSHVRVMITICKKKGVSQEALAHASILSGPTSAEWSAENVDCGYREEWFRFSCR